MGLHTGLHTGLRVGPRKGLQPVSPHVLIDFLRGHPGKRILRRATRVGLDECFDIIRAHVPIKRESVCE